MAGPDTADGHGDTLADQPPSVLASRRRAAGKRSICELHSWHGKCQRKLSASRWELPQAGPRQLRTRHAGRQRDLPTENGLGSGDVLADYHPGLKQSGRLETTSDRIRWVHPPHTSRSYPAQPPRRRIFALTAANRDLSYATQPAMASLPTMAAWLAPEELHAAHCRPRSSGWKLDHTDYWSR